MTERWSDRISERFRLKVDPDYRAWLDSGWWKSPCSGEFQHALPPDELLAATPDSIWAGFMLPDTLPAISNRYGDWLCLRVGPDDSVAEIVHWYHGGGDWLPFGNSLSEAIILDCTRASSPSASYASGLVKNRVGEDPTLWQWACERQGVQNPSLAPSIQLRSSSSFSSPTSDVSRQLSSNPAVLFDSLLNAINWPLKEKADPGLALRLQIPWEPLMVQWMFDGALIPDDKKKEVANALSISEKLDDLQDWNTATEIAQQLAGHRQDLGWVFDVLGWAYERSGRIEEALQAYRQGAMASVFSDQSITVRTHWYDERFRKFSAARLFAHLDTLPEAWQQDEYLNLLWHAPLKSGRADIRRYWLKQAQLLSQANNHAAAYDAFYRAGWDVGSHELMSYREILEGLKQSAESAGWQARAAVAALHLACLNARLA